MSIADSHEASTQYSDDLALATRNAAASVPAVSVETRIWLVLGYFALLGAAGALQPFVTGERCEWIAYMAATSTAPLVAIASPAILRRWTGRILLGGLLLFVIAGVLSRAYTRTESFTGGWLLPLLLTIPVAAVSHIPIFWIATRLQPISESRNAEGRQTESNAHWRHWLFAVLAVISSVLLLRQTSFWFDYRIVICWLLIAMASWLTWRAWFVSPVAVSIRSGRAIDGMWYAAFALGSLIPLYPPGYGAMHHWSFYQGPISLVQQGRLLLWEVPSQYGFLSILLPSAFPCRDTSMGLYVLQSLFLFIEAFAIYRMLRGVRDGVSFRVWAGLAALVAVYQYPGDRGSFAGPWEAPSGGVYRFFWVFALAVFLCGKRSLPRQVAGISFLVVVGSLWSIESAIYVLGTLGVTALAEAGILTAERGWSAGWRRWVYRYLVPTGSLLASVGLISLFYRLRFGFPPDWHAFIEYATSYASGFYSMPIDPWGAVLYLSLAAVAVLLYAVGVATRTGDAEVAGLFAPYGAMIGTASYFVSRSHESAACTLVAFWFGLLLLCYRDAVARRFEEWAITLRSLLLPTFVVMVAGAFCLEQRGLQRLKSIATQRPAWSVEQAFAKHYDPMFVLLPVIRSAIGDRPIVNLSGYYPATNLPALPNPPWLPIAPREEFFILAPASQRRHLERFLERRGVPEGILLRRDTPPWDPPDWAPMHKATIQIVDEVLPRYYDLSETTQLDDGYRLERWTRRPTAGEGG